MEPLQCTASPREGSVHCNSCRAVPHCLGAKGSGTPAMHCHTALGPWGQWAVQLLQRSASVPWCSGHCHSCNALPHRLGQRAAQLLQCTASLPRGSG